ncbi:MAG TPA: histidine kinase dimerization/phospho-acceptor domain-containing protein, partial [Coriobacteriia bacterium]|nr:histidine kinase dimerization/phospho-acceptor domain-containing protein [Coriobacteriia bacterium]
MSREEHDQERSASAAEDLLSLAIHELRTPLTVIAGYLQVLERRPLEDATRRRAIGESLKAVRRMAALLDDLGE